MVQKNYSHPGTEPAAWSLLGWRENKRTGKRKSLLTPRPVPPVGRTQQEAGWGAAWRSPSIPELNGGGPAPALRLRPPLAPSRARELPLAMPLPNEMHPL